jgi:hypothetical protein
MGQKADLVFYTQEQCWPEGPDPPATTRTTHEIRANSGTSRWRGRALRVEGGEEGKILSRISSSMTDRNKIPATIHVFDATKLDGLSADSVIKLR